MTACLFVGVYNILMHAGLISDAERRAAVLLKALNGRVTILILAAAVYIERAGPSAVTTHVDEAIHILVRDRCKGVWPSPRYRR